MLDGTRDGESSTDAVGAARRYSPPGPRPGGSPGALGGIGLCRVAVRPAHASRAGHALLDRALHLPGDRAADDGRRGPAGVPDGLASAARPRPAAAMTGRAREAGRPGQWPVQ
ncbi:transposase [Streptacidiphilus sp. ASG 303]|uniref:transposase n=1 Tax=Streptacidiphilus sp. ASG 303 TaxID=2896847 RepID=UPI0035AF3E23